MAAMAALAASSPGKLIAGPPPRSVVTVSNSRPREPAAPGAEDLPLLPLLLRPAKWPPWPLGRPFQSEEAAESLPCVVGVLSAAKTPGTAVYPREQPKSEHSTTAVTPSWFRSVRPGLTITIFVAGGFPDVSFLCVVYVHTYTPSRSLDVLVCRRHSSTKIHDRPVDNI